MDAHRAGSEERRALHLAPAESGDLGRYIDLLEEVAYWLETQGIQQWPTGCFRRSADYYAESIKLGEVQLAFLGDELVGTLRVVLRDPIVWPEVVEDDAVYVHNLAVGRYWTGYRFGRRMLEWAEDRTASLGRTYLRLDCFADNEFLQRYYEQRGFTQRGEVEARYPHPIGTLHLQRYEKRVQVR
ncbi:MAG: hypothetical protein DMG13_03240 [Acidobacteria bacterium]|nr:MAG: hypothetical protein DMG13_03240 [Acidobacteriota bacterium]